MHISEFSVRHRTTVRVLILLITIAGLSAYMSLPRESAPDIKIPYVTVISFYEGTSPSDMESLITRPIERKLKGITEIKEMRSTSGEGTSTITVEFEPDYNIDTALQKVRDKVDEATPDLPQDLDEPTVKEISASEIFPVLFVMASGEVGLPQLKLIAEDLEEDIEGIRGVLDASILGGLEREIRVEFDPDRLSGYGLTLAEVVQTVSRNNVTIPGGGIDIGEGRYSIKAPAEFTTPDEIDHLVVSARDGKPIYLSDIAVVRDTFKDRESYSRIDGREAVAIRVTKRAGTHLLKIADEVKGIVDKYRAQYSPQVAFTITSDSSDHVRTMVFDLENNIISGLILVLAVIFISIGFRNAILISLAIPLSMLISFWVIQAFGMTLNMIVLFSLILALGMLVDNAIVIVENIYRHHLHENRPIVEATIVGTKEVAWPVTTSTLTTVVAFLPLVFWPGIMGQFMGYLPKTVIIALLASLFAALVLNPALCAGFMRVSPREHGPETPGDGFFLRGYRRLVQFGLRYRILSLLMFFGLFLVLAYVFGASGLGVEMFPDTEPNRITVEIEAPEGTRVAHANRFALQAEEIVNRYGNIEHVTTAVGQGSGEESGPNIARIIVDLVDREFRRAAGSDGKVYFRNSNDTMEAMRRELLATIVGADVTVDKEEMGPPVGAPINVEIAGDDYAMLSHLADALKEQVRDLPGIVDLGDDYLAGLPELTMRIDKQRAALLGLDSFTVGQMVKTAVNGLKVADYREDEDEYDITVRLPENLRHELSDVLRLYVPDPVGHQIPLTSVATIEATSGLSAINHIDEKRVVTVSANVSKSYNAQEVLARVRQVAAGITLPAGYLLSFTGENEEFEESKAFMGRSFILALLLIALVLVTEFDSLVTPFIIMTSVILSWIGVFLGLLITQKPFGVIMTGMGVISLAGVVVNNAIVLIDYTNQLRQRGLSCHDAIVQAGCIRMRPVLLTAITTILGLVPMAIGISYNFRQTRWEIGSESTQWWGPMASVVIFGLLVATLLTLFVVPNLYSLFFNRSAERRRAAAPAPAAAPEFGLPTAGSPAA